LMAKLNGFWYNKERLKTERQDNFDRRRICITTLKTKLTMTKKSLFPSS
jgi:hypothetical protein